MSISVSRKQRRRNKRSRKTSRRHRGGAEEIRPPTAIAASEPAAAPPASTQSYILVECFPDSQAKILFKPDVKKGAGLDDKKYYFKIVDIKRTTEDKVQTKTTGWFSNKETSLGDVSKIILKGELVPSNHIHIKGEKIDIDIKPIPIQFKFSSNMKKINLLEPAIGKFEEKTYNLSNGIFTNKAALNYIPRESDMFKGKISSKFLTVLPNPKDKPVDTSD